MGYEPYDNNDCAWNHESWVEGLLVSFDITCSVFFFFCKTISILHNSAPKWRFLFFFPPPITNLQRECRSRAPLSAILIWDKNQSSTRENSISLMRYEYSCKRKSEIVCCFQTNPLKVIWSSAANYRAFWAASRLRRTPPPPFPTYPSSVHHIPSLCFRERYLASLRYYWGAGSWQADTAAQSCKGAGIYPPRSCRHCAGFFRDLSLRISRMVQRGFYSSRTL